MKIFSACREQECNMTAGGPGDLGGGGEGWQVPHQVSALTFYRYDQPIVDYCQAHQSLHLNMGFEGTPQGLEGLEDLGSRAGATVPAAPAASLANPRTTPTATPAGEGPGPAFPPAERSMLTFGR
ncbi:hypothetical protein AAFF_G00251770 [Aldrovandia affinis]|uniref:Uncharacterized protein n=1 Tax=Aldrovandia affinis TaxID=143900 RepID=A0AAD7STH5_9TELE|nr:hypothetical protein AAFF_G00251770 [Aldrovandia affinis]